ncbi:alanyl-tRNA editing protein [Metabacillus hrfriensis]|uniref:Alanyl-tRNA editing protein n=1 Tax=Metabacillus hrfriensis TaxID=3048891 RepID=A0ACD4R5X5_9BACI|nr:DHHA1 domain-containing protein [Metabacillus sp. CT-WN-B3]USK26596.1 alanyl-tRNA editing protein [Bacillus sp. CMF21]WHZ55819.1 alanyl-tRNA editing protein [Metabacillus sp. CT-WN-B3]
MNEKLFYSSPKTFEWKTTITETEERNGLKLLKLKETAFYPEGGGQPADHGWIESISIEGLVEDGEEIYHIVSRFPSEKEVTCKVDSKRRIDHMQHHSGQHLLSAVCLELFDYQTESFHLGADTVTIDLRTPLLSSEQIKLIEKKSNQYIFENRKIHTFFAEENKLRDLPLRKLPDVKEKIRIVQIEGIDTSACCGTHVERTGEIGMLKLIKTEKQKGMIRLHFKCGFRALSDYQNMQETVQFAGQFFQTSTNEIAARLKAMDQETKLIQKEAEQLRAENAAFTAEKMELEQNGLLGHGLFERKTIKELQLIAARLLENGKDYALLASISENCVLFSQKGTVHAGTLFKTNLADFDGKGGGSEKQAQAKFYNNSETKRFFLQIKEKIDQLI